MIITIIIFVSVITVSSFFDQFDLFVVAYFYLNRLTPRTSKSHNNNNLWQDMSTQITRRNQALSIDVDITNNNKQKIKQATFEFEIELPAISNSLMHEHMINRTCRRQAASFIQIAPVNIYQYSFVGFQWRIGIKPILFSRSGGLERR